MSKRILGLILILILLFALTVPAFAAEEIPAEPEETRIRPDGLPDVDVYDWPFLLADSYNSISLYDAKVSYLYGLGIDSRIYEETVAFIEDAISATGTPIYLNDANLSWLYYKSIRFQSVVEAYGDAYHACLNELAPGCDDHQTGLSIDITTDPSYCPVYTGDYETRDPYAKESEAYKWMAEHCAEYGFIVRYPDDKSDYYGVACKGAHFRYVGKDAAAYIMENNLCLEEFMILYGYPVVRGTAVKDGRAS